MTLRTTRFHGVSGIVRVGAALVAIGGLLVAAIVVSTNYAVNDGRERRIEAAVRDSQNIAFLIRANFERVVESIDLQIDEFLRGYGVGRSEEEMQEFFQTRRYPASVVQVAVADAEGLLVASNLRYPVERISVADREHFRVHADGKVVGTFISKPVRGRVSGLWTLNITRALRDGGGRFAGMVVFSYDLADFTRFYDSLDVGRRGIVAMTGLDGFVRVHSGSTEFFGADVSASQTFQSMLRERQSSYAVQSDVDGIARVGYFAASDRVPFIFLVAYDRAGILAEGARSETHLWAGCGLLVLLIAGAVAGTYHVIGQRERLRQVELYRLIERRNGALLDAVRSIPGLAVGVAAGDGRILSSNIDQVAGTIAGSRGSLDAEFLFRLEDLTARIASGSAGSFPLRAVDRFADAAGGEREVIWAAAEIADAGALPERYAGVGRFIVLGLDYTEQRRQESKVIHMSKLATLGEVATGMAHELNQPLNVIRMAAENALGRPGSDAETAAYVRAKLERIVAQVERAAKLIDHMRIFGRRGAASDATHDPLAAVDGALKILGEQMRVAAIAVTVRGTPGLCLIHCDQALIEQVILNLLLNARDAIEDRRRRTPGGTVAGRIEVSIDILVQSEASGRVKLAVSDNGGGIPKDILPRLFEPFFTTKPAGKGTGLGLSVSYGIVRDLGGTLSVVNIGEGACFEIELPCVLTREPAGSPPLA